jgi:hypothetical protein
MTITTLDSDARSAASLRDSRLSAGKIVNGEWAAAGAGENGYAFFEG